MTLAEQIRALQLGLPVGGTAHTALDRAAELAEAHESALVAAAYEAAADRVLRAGHSLDIEIRCMTDADAAAALARIKAEAVKEALSDFSKADWFWRDLDPDDSGDTPDEAINRGMVGRFAVCHIRSSFTGPDRFCFIAPVLDPESDDEECLCFATQEEAIAAAKERRTILAAVKEAGNE